jgi:hypothetical protein
MRPVFIALLVVLLLTLGLLDVSLDRMVRRLQALHAVVPGAPAILPTDPLAELQSEHEQLKATQAALQQADDRADAAERRAAACEAKYVAQMQ